MRKLTIGALATIVTVLMILSILPMSSSEDTGAARGGTLYQTNFETGAAGWTHGGSQDEWELGIPTYDLWTAHSGSNCWGTDLSSTYNNNANQYLQSPAIDLSSAAAAEFKFWSWTYYETYWDGINVQISTDGTSYSNIYSTSSSYWRAWTPMGLDVSGYIGYSTVYFRFVLHSDSSITRTGFYVDDVEIFEPEPKERVWLDDFSVNTGWSISYPWEINALGPCTSGYNGADPTTDHSPTTDNRVLGTNVPCTFNYRYMTTYATSPVIDCSDYEQVVVQHWTHDHTDYTPYQYWYLDVKDISGGWYRIWSGYSYPSPNDQSWRLVGPIDISSYADLNPTLQVRFGHYSGGGVFTVAGRNIDDIEVLGVPLGIAVEAKVEPETLNLDSMGNYINIKVENFPEDPDCSPLDVDGSTVELAGIGADLKYGTNNENRWIGKVDRLLIEDAIGSPGDDIELQIKGALNDGTKFKGEITLRAI